MNELDKENIKVYKNILNGNISDKELLKLKEIFKDVSVEQVKEMLGKVKSELNKSKRKYFLTSILKQNILFEYVHMQGYLIGFSIKKEKERAFKFLNNEKMVEKYNLNAKKENQQKLEEWTKLAYPNIEITKWEAEFDMNLMIQFLKNN
jgi:uncharacterized membrane protein YqiK